MGKQTLKAALCAVPVRYPSTQAASLHRRGSFTGPCHRSLVYVHVCVCVLYSSEMPHVLEPGYKVNSEIHARRV